MNTRAIVLLSILGNIGLLACAIHLHRSRKPSLPSYATAQAQTANLAKALPSRATETKVEVVTNDVVAEFRWQQIESANCKAYVANLRAIDCPEETVRDIIAADVNKLYAQKRKALWPETKANEYWKKDPSWRSVSATETDRQAKSRALEKEKSELLKSLLGVDPIKERNKENGYEDSWDWLYSFTSEEKKQQLRDANESYDQKLQALYRVSMRDDDDEKEIRKLRREKLAAAAGILSPQEFEEYELRTAQIAVQLRHDLDGFEPSAQEFREIYKLRKAREDDLAYVSDPDDEDGQDKRLKAVTALEQQIKQMLGEQCFAEYEHAQDHSYKELVRALKQNDLPTMLANKAYEMKTGAEQAARRVRSDESLSPEQRNEALKAIRGETEKGLSQQLGENVFSSYKRSGGYWLNNLVPRETTRRP
ncbi:MAG TPA: hypothetical protein VK846_09630 [Candidatus Limnocylindria bacterium]|nr:hypothetical protein [Candidatus Limnocylindria bacterium]